MDFVFRNPLAQALRDSDHADRRLAKADKAKQAADAEFAAAYAEVLNANRRVDYAKKIRADELRAAGNEKANAKREARF